MRHPTKWSDVAGYAFMQPTLPSWFKQRQAKAEAAGDNTFRLTGPNLREAYISIRQAENGRWSAALRPAATEPETAVTEPVFEKPSAAWEAAFELYRSHVVT